VSAASPSLNYSINYTPVNITPSIKMTPFLKNLSIITPPPLMTSKMIFSIFLILNYPYTIHLYIIIFAPTILF